MIAVVPWPQPETPPLSESGELPITVSTLGYDKREALAIAEDAPLSWVTDRGDARLRWKAWIVPSDQAKRGLSSLSGLAALQVKRAIEEG